jgi:glycosyltransferase involved in cell wall biosynthesis
MKIAYIYCPIPVHGHRNGIISQCLTWAEGLRKLGNKVDLISCWEDYDWSSYDIIHLFGSTGTWFFSLIQELLDYNKNIVWSPICDDTTPTKKQRVKTLMGSKSLHLFSLPYIRSKTYQLPIKVFARSEYEKKYLIDAYGASAESFEIVPLGLSYCDSFEKVNKENFCFHLSSLYQPRKNVVRLIQAARKYKFELVLAGTKGSAKDFAPLEDAIGNAKNITVLGRIPEEKKKELYIRAKVFALPSVSEGVGIVALDAAHYGCDVVMTNFGGPKEYYNGMAEIVDPYDVGSIGKAIVKLMSISHQPQLKEYVDKEFSSDRIAEKLVKAYKSMIISK